MFRRIISLAAGGMMAFFGAAAAQEAAPTVIKAVKEFPKAEAATWGTAVKGLTEISFGQIATSNGKTGVAVRAFLAYNAGELYALFVATEPSTDKIVARLSDPKADHDSNDAWRDDCVELFLATSPDNWNAYYQVIVNSKGVVADSKGEGPSTTDTQWAAEAAVRTAVIPGKDSAPGCWLAEIRLPFKNLGGAPKAGGVWQINLARERQVDGPEDFSWAPITGSFHQPDLFMKVLFGGN